MANQTSRDEVLLRAASVIAEFAESLKDCHTIRGEWPDDELDVKDEYEGLASLSLQLIAACDGQTTTAEA